MEIECYYTDPPHVHEYPDDWVFGGADGLDPRADPRWEPSLYIYYDADTQELYRTVTPLCQDQALDEFTKVAKITGSDPKWLSVRHPREQAVMLPWTYDKRTDMLTAV